MKIGILTLFYNNYNWGGVLQGFALKTLLEHSYRDVQVDILAYNAGKNIIYPTLLKQMRQYSVGEIAEKVTERLLKNEKTDLEHQLKQRKALFDKFFDMIKSNPTVYTDETLCIAGDEYDCLISGSDQVWNPNVARAGFFQSMITGDCVKVAYAASIARDGLSRYERKIMIPLIERFDATSVREKSAKRMLEHYMSDENRVVETLDPAMMLTAEDWMRLSGGPRQTAEKYVLAFFFSESLRYRKVIEKYCQQKNLKLKFIPFARQEFLKSDEIGDCERVYDVGPVEFIHLFQNAEYVFTDSFHGSVFSIIFHKQFCIFERDKQTKVSKNSRLYDLLEKFDLSNRLVQNLNIFDRTIKQKIDYQQVENLLAGYRADSMRFLDTMVELIQSKKNPTNEGNFRSIKKVKKTSCVGCGLCASECPTKCIQMYEDKEGFYYPKVDDCKCIQCGRCLSNCPTESERKSGEGKDAYVGFSKDEGIRNASSSGGLFYELAKTAINEGGVVYGANFEPDFSVKHKRVDSLERLNVLLTSKYVQSDTRGIFLSLIEDLKSGKTVLFAGTPCQVAAAYKTAMQKKLTDNLILVDFICHGVPSPALWKSYLKFICKKDISIESVNFRNKSHGWHDYHLYIKYKNSSCLRQSHELNAYMRSFLSDQNLRPSCYSCNYKKDNYSADITLGDAWKIEKDYPAWADNKGTSLIIVRSTKGRDLLEKVSMNFNYRETNYEQWTIYNPSLVRATARPENREVLFNAYHNTDNSTFWKLQKKVPLVKQARYQVKQFLHKIGLEKTVRRFQ